MIKRTFFHQSFTVIIFVASVLAASCAPIASAQTGLLNQTFTASVGPLGLKKDLAMRAFEPAIEVGFPIGRLSAPTVITLMKLTETSKAPAGLTLASPLYQIDIPTTAFKAGDYFVTLPSSKSSAYKQVYFFDRSANLWKPLPTTENYDKGIISVTLSQPFVRFAVFENPKMLVAGDASWYRYKNGLFAASPDFPAGTRLRVTNPVNKKFVDVTVNDHGPNRVAHPTRVVDLDAVAFALIAPLGQGTVRVTVQQLTGEAATLPVVPSEKPVETPPPGAPATDNLNTGATAAFLLNSADNKVIWSKNENAVVPLASLTKLIAIKTFLQTKPNLNKVVAYSLKDEQQNLKYVSAVHNGRLHLKDGDTLSIKDLVYSSLIGSTNNTVETLVRVSGLSREDFIKKMNENVAAWGTIKTHFIEPTGLAPQNVTTAYEYAIIARQVFSDPLIAEATVRQRYNLTTVNTKKPHFFPNTNLLAREKGSGLLGSKTGYLTEAGYCLVTKWPTSKDKNIIAVVLGAATRQGSVDDTKKLVRFAEKNIK